MDIWRQVNAISAEKDIKLQKLKEILSGPLKGEKALIFTYYKDTARYLFSELGEDKGAAFRKTIGNPVIKRMDSGTDPKSRRNIVKAFAPKANKKEEWLGTEHEINILISTDVLSEGQNLQDCANLINYDLHWNPTRMVQRAGRIVDNRFLIANLISCSPETELVIGDYAVFEIQEKIIEHILKTYHEKLALESVPKVIDPVQQTLATTIQNYLNHPDVDRKEALKIIKYLNQPMPGTQVKELRKFYKDFQINPGPKVLLEKITAMRDKYGNLSAEISPTERFDLKREDLNLICFDYLCG